ncbi:hypothetical protein A6A40_27305 (plasmid) [Azospirillum humicireducens]|uniref:Serine/threonine protein kinase n=1 Tax=Azospirillum humicireducens TaxID=1226968 RepID=A0A2R4VW32_9PROT|nr:hypothetical protein [Azospirillum humicireducens]AWB08676.1 hypothetical protein A6A40_27305 [Azospirillum humicireducens]
MRKSAAALLLSVLLAGLPLTAIAQQPARHEPAQQQPAPSIDSGAKESAGDALARDNGVQKSQDPLPSQQGNKPPSPSSSAATGSGELQQALADVRRAPPDLNGTPVPRPNRWASEPNQINEPTRSQSPSDLTSRDVK